MKKFIILFIVFSCILSGCTPAEQADTPSAETPETSSAASSETAASVKEESSSSSSSEPESASEAALTEEETKSLLAASQEQYPDAVAWLYVPGTDISDCVMQGKDNSTYWKTTKDGTKTDYWATDDCLFMDYESLLGDGTPSGISQNTIIYGFNYGTWLEAAEKSGWRAHSEQAGDKKLDDLIALAPELYQLTEESTQDDPEAPSFSQLLHFADESFAKEHPYLYLTTPAQTLVFEIFMAGYVDPTTDPSYIYAEYSDEDFMRLVQVIREYSLYIYEKDVTPSDRILTLSTDTFRFPNMVGKYNQRAKFVVMAVLTDTDETLHESARLQPNPSPKQPTLQPCTY